MHLWGNRRKVLGVQITKSGIKPHPKKDKAIINMKAPKTIKEVQHLNGSIAALKRFLTKSVEKCRPFYDLLKTNDKQMVK